MKKFEYKIVTLENGKHNIGINLDGSEAILTGEGLEGWEAVSTFQSATAYGYLLTHTLMKREITK